MRYVLKLSYDGTRYAGWQRQKNALSVQEALEDGMARALGGKYSVTASGRTDAGVHAAGQTCHFDAEGLTVPPEKAARLHQPLSARGYPRFGGADGRANVRLQPKREAKDLPLFALRLRTRNAAERAVCRAYRRRAAARSA